MRVTNMTSKSGNPVANQFIIEDRNKRTFQSYDSTIAVIEYSQGRVSITLDEFYWNYSTITSKYRNLFLGETKKETQAKIDSGEYKLAELN